MISEGFIAKAAAVPVGVVAAAEAVHSGFEWVVLMAATLAAVGYMARLSRRGLRNTKALVARVHVGLDIIETTPDHFKALEQRVGRLERHVDVLAEADRLRVKDAIAGDNRSPVDRRRAA